MPEKGGRQIQVYSFEDTGVQTPLFKQGMDMHGLIIDSVATVDVDVVDVFVVNA